MKKKGQTEGQGDRKGIRGMRWLRVTAAWLLAVSLAAVGVPSAAKAAVGSVGIVGVSPTNGSVLQALERLEISVLNPDGDLLEDATYRIQRLGDGRYLTDDPANPWTDGFPVDMPLTDGGGGTYHEDLAAWQTEALQEDGTYEIYYQVNYSDGTATVGSTKPVRFTIDRTGPSISEATVTRETMFLTWTEPLKHPENLTASDIDVRVNGDSVPLSFAVPVQNEPNALVLLQDPIAKFDEVTVAFTADSALTDEAGNAVSKETFSVVNRTPGTFEEPPTLRMKLEAGHSLRAGEGIVRFTPTSDGGTYLIFDWPSESLNPPTFQKANIQKSDFVVREVGGETVIHPEAVAVTSGVDPDIYRIEAVLPIGTSLSKGHTYELALSDSAGGDEFTMPDNPTMDANAYLQLCDPNGDSYLLDEYEFAEVSLVEKAPADFDALLEAVHSAQEKHNAATEGAANGQYAPGAKAALQAAINAAAAVTDKPWLEQEEVDAAQAVLEKAVAAFEAKRVDVKLTALTEAIATAQAKHDAATEGGANGQYAPGAKAALQEAIDAASAVRGNEKASQAQVNAALDALEEAVATFEAKRVDIDLTALTVAIAAAQKEHDAAVEGGASGQYEAGSKAALRMAIAAAAGVRDGAASTQPQVDAAVTALHDAVLAFEAKKNGDGETPGGGGGGDDTPGSGGGTPGSAGGIQSQEETYAIDVPVGEGQARTLQVVRKTAADGRVQDTVALSESFAEQAAALLKQAGWSRLAIVMPEKHKTAQRLSVVLPAAAANRLSGAGIALEFRTAEARLSVPAASLGESAEALTFTVASVRDANERSNLERRANGTQLAGTGAAAGKRALVGVPVTISAPQKRSFTVALPMPDSAGTPDASLYFEHGDGQAELVNGRVQEPEAGASVRYLGLDASAGGTIAIVRNEAAAEPEPSALQLLNVPYLSGYAGRLFKPHASLTRAEMAAIVSRLVDGTTGSAKASFSDVPDGHWAGEAIRRTVALGILNGDTAGAFRPDRPITRAETAAILSRLLTSASPNASAEDFSDTVGHWAQMDIRKVRAAGLMTGYLDGTFHPERALSRAEAAVVLNKLIGRAAETGEEPRYADVPATHWAYGAIQAAAIR
ncbi:S-layer homology domain-containing protein [Cohnella nanjingensis]|uniref:S-layer homology domain-containing protein n=1 Tax=Cohnella nanjingensis TaxID=1387779 RepID=A0A7X0RTU8_9BACL|nr:S-layer homology domain-containing protein [Cohnella nanjingensis]MBB6673574.1 S-layer homology domain-containing protein [Cohnella nanjingensis]